jgi:hypothetical protein
VSTAYGKLNVMAVIRLLTLSVCITAITFNLPHAVDTDYVCITAITFNLPQAVDTDCVCITATTQ